MSPDTVQIGSLVISKTLFDILVPLVSGLIGTITGGFITYLTTRAIEGRKWQREKEEKLKEQKREAISVALEWIAPLDQSLTQASIASSAFQQGDIDQEKFLKDYPYVISSLTTLDPPARLRVMLPENSYAMSLEVIRGIDELKSLALRGRMKSFMACTKLVSALRQKIDKLDSYLKEEYLKTFS